MEMLLLKTLFRQAAVVSCNRAQSALLPQWPDHRTTIHVQVTRSYGFETVNLICRQKIGREGELGIWYCFGFGRYPKSEAVRRLSKYGALEMNEAVFGMPTPFQRAYVLSVRDMLQDLVDGKSVKDEQGRKRAREEDR